MKLSEQKQIFYTVALLFGIVSSTLTVLSLNASPESLAGQGVMLYALIAAIASVLFFLIGYRYPSKNKKTIFDKKIDPSLILAVGAFAPPLAGASFEYNYVGIQTLLYLIGSFLLFLGIGGIIHDGIRYSLEPVASKDFYLQPRKRRTTRTVKE